MRTENFENKAPEIIHITITIAKPVIDHPGPRAYETHNIINMNQKNSEPEVEIVAYAEEEPPRGPKKGGCYCAFHTPSRIHLPCPSGR
jgi:hypothetical protein